MRDAARMQVTKLTDLAPADTVCSVGWSQKGTYLSVGTNSGKVQLWDVSKMAMVRWPWWWSTSLGYLRAGMHVNVHSFHRKVF